MEPEDLSVFYDKLAEEPNHDFVFWKLVDEFKYTNGRVLVAWEAWRYARKNNIPAPDWVLGYLDRCADKLLETPLTSGSKHVMAALGLETRGQGTAWDQLQSYRNEIEAAFKVLEWNESGKKGLDKICGEVAEDYGIDKKRVRKAYDQLRDFPPKN